jgi:hypothetical protein
LVYSAHGTEYKSEYGYFALTGSPILPNIVAGVEIPLFRFRTQACIGSIRMYRNVADGTGGADTPVKFCQLDIFEWINGALSESYKDNYGTATVCPTPPVSDLTTSISIQVQVRQTQLMLYRNYKQRRFRS